MVAPHEKCQFFLARKKRTCKFDVVPGKRFCGNHLPPEESGGRRRIPCPWDPKGAHDIFEDEVDRHKACCPAYVLLQSQEAAPYFCRDINAGPPLAVPSDHTVEAGAPSLAARRARLALSRGSASFDELVARIGAEASRLATPTVHTLNEAEAAPPGTPEAKTASVPPYSAKHAAQQASIVGHLERFGLLESAERDVFIELGAGRGYLGAALGRHCPRLRSIVLVDCRGFKLKADRALRTFDLLRIRCDLKDFFVSGASPLASATLPVPRWVGLAKHLCGAATDFALRAALEQERRGEAGAKPAECRGIGIATCCHHRCTWRAFTGKAWFEQHGFSPEDFELISWMTGWALCGHEAPAGEAVAPEGLPEPEEKEPASHPNATDPASVRGGGAEISAHAPLTDEPLEARHEQKETTSVEASDGTGLAWDPRRAYSRAKRIEIGQQCKALIDSARLHYLGAAGFEAELAAYVAPEISGENKILLARRTCA